jgi:hypothetical protein
MAEHVNPVSLCLAQAPKSFAAFNHNNHRNGVELELHTE